MEAIKSFRRRFKHYTGEFREGYANWLLSGTYSSRLYLKQENEKAQTMLENVIEPLSVFSWLLPRLLSTMISSSCLVRQGIIEFKHLRSLFGRYQEITTTLTGNILYTSTKKNYRKSSINSNICSAGKIGCNTSAPL